MSSRVTLSAPLIPLVRRLLSQRAAPAAGKSAVDEGLIWATGPGLTRVGVKGCVTELGKLGFSDDQVEVLGGLSAAH